MTGSHLNVHSAGILTSPELEEAPHARPPGSREAIGTVSASTPPTDAPPWRRLTGVLLGDNPDTRPLCDLPEGASQSRSRWTPWQ